ncbi:MAG: 50S ribosomal protein L18 [Candidatus Firestonebacteria bacterium]|nr:50S ribosomal protein L18 [Candidatus Firestonebacteria bacterium]
MVFQREALRVVRHKRIRKKLSGTTARPRMCIKKTLKHTYAQLVDDVSGKILLTVSTLSKDLTGIIKAVDNKAAAKDGGALFAKKCIEKGFKTIVFDRSGYIYHGKVKQMADEARKEGLVF